MKLIIIAALTKNRVIGKAGKIPWNIPEDLKRFKTITSGHVVLMGRKTYESLKAPLTHRRNVVLTSHPIPSVETYSSFESALLALQNEDQVFVIGGAKVFQKALPFADQLYLTLVCKEIQGDAYFPEYEDYVKKNFRLCNTVVSKDAEYFHYEKLAS